MHTRPMFVCSDIDVAHWRPDFSSSAQTDPEWFRVRCCHTELTNALNWIDWSENPIQVMLCEACGHEGCSSGGYVHVSRLGGYVLWTMPQVDLDEAWQEGTYLPLGAIEKHGAIALPLEAWDQFRTIARGIPDMGSLPSANGLALAEAWALGPGRPANVMELGSVLRDRLIGADTLERVEALTLVERTLESLLAQRAHATAPAEAMSARIETLYFDGPQSEDWPAFAIAGQQVLPALTSKLVLIPNS